MKIKVRCQACEEIMATIDTENISLPLTGAMFEAHEPVYAPPFHPTNTFNDFRCPYGPHDAETGHRPFFKEGEFLTEFYRIWKIGDPVLNHPIRPEEKRQQEIDRQFPENESLNERLQKDCPEYVKSLENWVEPVEPGQKLLPCRSTGRSEWLFWDEQTFR